jgi:hypothetical protein
VRAAVQRGAFSPTLAHDWEVRTATEVCIAQRATTWLFEWIDIRRREQEEEARTGHGEDGPASTDEENRLKDEMDNFITEIDRHAKKLRMLCVRVCGTVRMGDFLRVCLSGSRRLEQRPKRWRRRRRRWRPKSQTRQCAVFS